MKIKNIEIVPGCISCGTCEFICPQAFEVKDVASVKEGVYFDSFVEEINQAADSCPVSVIKVKRNNVVLGELS